jgi:hypothetical protein
MGAIIKENIHGCSKCDGEHYILHGCCSGASNQCGCMGQPVLITNCELCNPAGDLPMGEYVGDWADQVEYRFKQSGD